MTGKGHVAERRCIVSGETSPQAGLVRFVVGPDDVIVPDIKGKLPGRGLWVSARRDMVEAACAKNAFARAARQRVSVPEGLPELIESQLAAGCLALLGLARKAGELVAGFEKVKAWLQQGAAVALVTASDAAEDGRRKLHGLAAGVPEVDAFSAEQLSLALGRGNVVHAALREGGLARRFLADVNLLAAYRRCEGPEGPSETRTRKGE
ncbi:MAG: RNA-binding protein [Alphaproteobacteria bacterium]|nr:RNA-binding protein [Alphaproteobacteria bacterium]